MNQTTIRFTNGEKSFLSKEPLALCDIASLMSETGQNRRSTYVSTENMMKNYQGVVFDNSDELVNGIIYKPGDVLVSNIRPYLKKAWLADRCGVCSSDVLCIRPNDGIKSSYLFSLIARDSFFTNMMRAAKGSKMPRGDKENTMAFPVNFCTESEEQEKIGGFFTELDNLISAAADEVAALEEAKKGMMQKIFSREIRFMRDDGTEYPEWDDRTLEESSTMIKDGTHGTHQDVKNGFILLSAKDIYDGAIHKPINSRRISQADYEAIYKTYKLEPGDIVLTIVGTLGRVAIVSNDDTNVAFQRSVAIIRPNDSTNSQFLRYVIEGHSFQKELDTKKSRGAQAGVYLGALADIVLSLPCLEEQQKIASILTSLDDAIAAAKDELAGYRELKRGLLQQMFA